jgi:hypothetical protein
MVACLADYTNSAGSPPTIAAADGSSPCPSGGLHIPFELAHRLCEATLTFYRSLLDEQTQEIGGGHMSALGFAEQAGTEQPGAVCGGPRPAHWRDETAHGIASNVSEIEAHEAIARLLRFAQFTCDNWNELTGGMAP